MEQWAPFLYVYGVGTVVFALGMYVAWRSGALRGRALITVLVGGLFAYGLFHGLFQTLGEGTAMPATGKARGTKGMAGTWIDAVVVIGYFATVVGVGSYFARYTRTSTDFFFGGRRFAGWLVALSCVATTIGSYSFLKYASVGFRFGLSSTMSYLNDWFWMPLWMAVWLPIIYYGRIRSVPEYFQRRFGRPARMVATAILLVYLVGYISINFFTLGKAVHALTGYSIFGAACVAAATTSVYVAFGGQTSVIMTDLAQAVLLLVVGIGLFVVGVWHVGGPEVFWNGLPASHRTALAPLDRPDAFHTMGVFWQDAMAGGIAYYFMNQGLMMRFMSARSVHEGRKAVGAVVILVMPLAALAVSGVGWVGRVMADTGEINPMIDPDNVFVIVSEILAVPGVFGLIMAALIAALMSTADTLVTAVSAIIVNDIWMPFFADEDIKVAEGGKDLKVARIATVSTSAFALMLVPLFMQFDSIYVAHAAFTAAVVPPMAVALVIGAIWKRYSQRAALMTMVGGAIAVGASLVFPELIDPFAQGAARGGEGMKAHKYMRALYGLVVSGGLAVVGGMLFGRKEDPSPLLVAGPETASRDAFKGAPSKDFSASIRLAIEPVERGIEASETGDEVVLRMHPDDQTRMKAEPGDLIHVSAPGWWHGGLKSLHAKIAEEDGTLEGYIELPRELLRPSGLHDEEEVIVSLEA